MAILAENKKAYFDYEILERFEAGMKLLGWEVKAIKGKKTSLAGARAIIRAGEIFLVGLDIAPYQPNNPPQNYEEQRTIKLLLSKKEINRAEGKISQKGLTLVPLKLYTKSGKIKAEVALVKGKKQFEKREKIKERETKRKIGRIIKEQ